MAARIGTLPVVETSEEIRLQLVKLLGGVLMKRCTAASLHAVMREVMAVFIHACNDPYHEVIKSTSKAVVALTQLIPRGAFDLVIPIGAFGGL
jgi:hypothetical protein